MFYNRCNYTLHNRVFKCVKKNMCISRLDHRLYVSVVHRLNIRVLH